MSAPVALVEQAKEGDDEAFEELVRPYVDRLYGAARLMLRDADLAHDAVQQTLVAAWRQLPRLRDNALFEPWLQRLLVTSCHDEGRRRQRWTAKLRLVAPGETTVTGPDIGDRDAIGRALGKLSTEHRTVLVLHFYFDLAAPEIADRLGVAKGTVASRLHYALRALRAAVEADERPRVGGAA